MAERVRPAQATVTSAVRAPQELTIEDVSRRFGDVLALDRTSLNVAAGELMALLGPSGCGKTTTLRIIAGFEVPDTGRILIGGRDVSGTPTHRRGLGMVSQDYCLFPHMTITENVAFGLRMAGLPRADRDRRVTEMLELVRLTGIGARYPNQLSGGQQQRVALARALVINPALLLLDEPLAALDKNLRESMQFELRRIQRLLGITTVMVTHDQEEALTLADRVAVMNHGRILQIGSPRDVYDFPRTRFVSEFLGTANLFDASVGGADGEGWLRLELMTGHSVRLPVTALGERRGTITVAVRPEKIDLADASPPDASAMRAVVAGHVFRGSYHAYELEVPGHAAAVFAYQQAQSRQGQRVFDRGEDVYLSWNPHDLIVLDDDPGSPDTTH
jgi:spermidine/putrescine ABC transporter ATP-binding subunit